MTSIVLKSSSAMSSPADDTPYLPDVATSLLYMWQMASLAGTADAATVASWLSSAGSGAASGNGAINGVGSSLSKPTYSSTDGPGGSSCLEFVATTNLQNGSYTAISSSLSGAFLAKATADGWVFSIGNQLRVRYLAASGFTFGSTTTTDNIVSGAGTDGAWTPIIWTYDYSTGNTKLLAGTDSEASILAGTVPIASPARITLGAPASTVAGFVGAMSDIRLYNRVLADQDMLALQYLLSRIIATGS